MTKRRFVVEARARGWVVVKRRGLVYAARDRRVVVAGPAVGVAYAARLLDEPSSGFYVF